ncbi:MAG: hypothetical protein IPH45_17735 [Bacteroidales bacterium]|nr:hypothetical protein [Bacteroidales bacterium]
MAEKKSKLVEIKTKPTSASVEDFIKMFLMSKKKRGQFCAIGNDEKSNWRGACIMEQFNHRIW